MARSPPRGGDIWGPVPRELLCWWGRSRPHTPASHGRRHSQATAPERTNLGCSLQPATRGPPGKPVIVHGKAKRAPSPGLGSTEMPPAAPQDGAQRHPGIRCW